MKLELTKVADIEVVYTTQPLPADIGKRLHSDHPNKYEDVIGAEPHRMYLMSNGSIRITIHENESYYFIAPAIIAGYLHVCDAE